PLYPTLAIHNGVNHVIAGPWLGDDNDAPDAEGDGQPDPNALGDDSDGNDDEDGVITSPLAAGQSGAVVVKINDGAGGTGAGRAYLDAWIDFNGDQVWQAVEQIFSGWLPHGAHVLPFLVPAGSTVGQTFGRFRINSQGPLGPRGPAEDGEVEDHEVWIRELPDNAKWVQWPDLTPHGIDIKVDGTDPRSVLADDFECTQTSLLTDVHLWGSWLDDRVGEIENIHLSIHADDPIGDEGMRPDNLWSMPGELLWQYDAPPDAADLFYELPEPYREWWWDPMGGVLMPDGDSQVWQVDIKIDPAGPDGVFRQEGTPEEPKIYWLDVHVDTLGGEFGWKTRQFPDHFMDDAVFSDGDNWRDLHYPAGHPYGGADPSSIDMAFMLTFEEMPDNVDFGDAPEIAGAAGYPTTLAKNGARHIIAGPWLGDASDMPDAEPDGQPDPNALGDDNDGNDDEDGVQIPVLVQGQTANITYEVSNAPAGDAFVDGWIDWNGDQTWQASEQILLPAGPLGDGIYTVPVTPPLGSVVGQTFARFRINTRGHLGPTGPAVDGEVEDHEVFIEPYMEDVDFGDAPDSPFALGYPTLAMHNGANHVIRGPWLGDDNDGPDAEPDGQPDPNALGDD
ncbi:MAG: GEVED domain-containing protein, partial [Phycisphaerae bacterium]